MNNDKTMDKVFLKIGEVIISQEPVVISTILGSCVSVCLYSLQDKIGGMIHFALPTRPANENETDYKYGEDALSCLLDELINSYNISKTNLFAKVVGGGIQKGENKIGEENIACALNFLKQHNIPIVASDLGGTGGRKVHFHTENGKLFVAHLSKNNSRIEESDSSGKKIRLLIVEDVKTVRKFLNKIIAENQELEVVAEAANGIEALDIVKSNSKIDLISLDLKMPGMNGLEFLREVFKIRPMRILILSALKFHEGDNVLEALTLGALDYIQKPDFEDLWYFKKTFFEKIKTLSQVPLSQISPPKTIASKIQDRVKEKEAKPLLFSRLLINDKIIAIGASTGGTEAIKQLLLTFPKNIPPVLIVQHIPPVFSSAFAQRLGQILPFKVKEAAHGDVVQEGTVYIAPGGQQMKVVKKNGALILSVNNDPLMSGHRPSVDYLFTSVAEQIGKKAIGVILTGMGRDGAEGLLKMKNAGAYTLSQDEASCVVYGMPRAAAELNAVQKVLPLDQIAEAIFDRMDKHVFPEKKWA